MVPTGVAATNTATANAGLVVARRGTNRRPRRSGFEWGHSFISPSSLRSSGFVRSIFQVTTAAVIRLKKLLRTHRGNYRCRPRCAGAESLVRKTERAPDKRVTRCPSNIRLDWSGNRTGTSKSRLARPHPRFSANSCRLLQKKVVSGRDLHGGQACRERCLARWSRKRRAIVSCRTVAASHKEKSSC